MKYTIQEHRHRYSCWTASRAVQRWWNWAKNNVIISAINNTNLRQFAEKNISISTINEYNKFHEVLCENLIKLLPIEDVSYWRVAKIVSVYLKTSVIINGNDLLGKIIHPPIDDILLRQYEMHTKI